MDAGFAEDVYKTALVALENGRIEATRTLKKVSVLQRPTVPQYPLEPRRIYKHHCFHLGFHADRRHPASAPPPSSATIRIEPYVTARYSQVTHCSATAAVGLAFFSLSTVLKQGRSDRGLRRFLTDDHWFWLISHCCCLPLPVFIPPAPPTAILWGSARHWTCRSARKQRQSRRRSHPRRRHQADVPVPEIHTQPPQFFELFD